MQDHSFAIVFHGPDDVRVDSIKLGPFGEDDIIVKTHYTMVSSGTELRALTGYYQKHSPFPFIPGYVTVGEVIAVGCKVRGFRVGDRVSCRNANPIPGLNSCWGGQASHVICNTLPGSARPVILPTNADLLDYVIAEIGAISYRGVEAAAVQKGERAVVIGLGPIGAFSTAWLHARECHVIATDLEPSRLQRAAAWGADETVQGGTPESEDRLLALAGGGVDIVIETSGSLSVLPMACRLLSRKPRSHGELIGDFRGNWPRLLLQATYSQPVSLSDFPGEGLTVLTPKDRGVADRQCVIHAIQQHKIRPADFVGEVIPVNQAPNAYRALRDNKDCHFSVVFDWTSVSESQH